MQNDFNNAGQPDFRHMTPAEIKDAISTLNPLIRDLKRFIDSGHSKYLAGWKEGTAASQKMAKLLPMHASIVNRLAEMPVRGNGEGVRGLVGLAYPIRDDAEELRKKYKTVWRARPGRRQFDLSKRIGRENIRTVRKITKDFPFMP
jgi:hypothetical protein